jgi:hypothetical protein
MSSERILQNRLRKAVKTLRRQNKGHTGALIKRSLPEHSLVNRYGGGFIAVSFAIALSYPFIAEGKNGDLGRCWAGLAFVMLHLVFYFHVRLRRSLFEDQDLQTLAVLPADLSWLAQRQFKRAMSGGWWPVSLVCLTFIAIGLMLGLQGWSWLVSALVAPLFLIFSLATGYLIGLWPLVLRALLLILVSGWVLCLASIQIEWLRNSVLESISESGALLSVLVPTGWMARFWWGLCVDGHSAQLGFLLPILGLIVLAWRGRADYALVLKKSLEARLAFSYAEPPDWFSNEDRDAFAASLTSPKLTGLSEIEERIKERRFLRCTPEGEPTALDSWFWARLSERSKAVAKWIWSGFWLGLGRAWLRAALWLVAVWVGCWLIKGQYPNALIWLYAIGLFKAVGAGGGYGQSAFASSRFDSAPIKAQEVLWHQGRLVGLSLAMSAPLLLAHALLISVMRDASPADAFSWWLHGTLALAALGIWWSGDMGGVAIRGWRIVSWMVKYGTIVMMVPVALYALIQGGSSAWVASLICLCLGLAKSYYFCWLHNSVRIDL